jgi:hypothetical protein
MHHIAVYLSPTMQPIKPNLAKNTTELFLAFLLGHQARSNPTRRFNKFKCCTCLMALSKPNQGWSTYFYVSIDLWMKYFWIFNRSILPKECMYLLRIFFYVHSFSIKLIKSFSNAYLKKLTFIANLLYYSKCYKKIRYVLTKIVYYS